MGKKSSVTTALLLAIVPAVAIYWLTQGLPGWLSKKPADPPATQMVDGRVIDAGEQRLVSGAAVVLEIGGVNNSDTTDSEGRFLFVLTRAATPLAALLIVRAQGYEAYSLNVALETPELVQDIALQRQAEPPAPTPGASGAARIPPLMIPKSAVKGPSPQPQTAPSAPAAKSALPLVRLTSAAAGVPYTKRPLTTAVRITLPTSKK
jgi:hypothetical protein